MTPLEKAKCVILRAMMAVASHGNIAAGRHRVAFGKRRRLSVICFQGLKYDTPIPYPGPELTRSLLENIYVP